MQKKLKKENALSKFNDLYDYQNVLCDLILTQFNKEIFYDYTIPPPIIILGIVKKSLDKWNTKSILKKDLYDLIAESEFDGDSILRRYLWTNNIFGHEWFFGKGDYFRFRKEQKTNAISRIYNHPKLANKKEEDVTKLSLKKDVNDFINILYKNIDVRQGCK